MLPAGPGFTASPRLQLAQPACTTSQRAICPRPVVLPQSAMQTKSLGHRPDRREMCEKSDVKCLGRISADAAARAFSFMHRNAHMQAAPAPAYACPRLIDAGQAGQDRPFRARARAQGTTTEASGAAGPGDCLRTCEMGEYNQSGPLALDFGEANADARRIAADAASNASAVNSLWVTYSNIAALEGQPIAANLSVARLARAKWLGHLPGLGTPGGPAAGLRFAPTCSGPGAAEVDLTLRFVGDDGQFATPVALPLVRLVVFGLGGAGGADISATASTSDGLFAFQAGDDVAASRGSGSAAPSSVTFAAPSVQPSAGHEDGAVALHFGAVDVAHLRLTAACPLGRPVTVTVALAGGDAPALADLPVDELSSPPGPCFPCPPGTYKAIPGPGPCYPCPAGTYRGEGGGQLPTDCELCPAHSSSAAVCALTVDVCACDPGFESSAQGSEMCAPCVPGKYRGPADTGCRPCPSGTYGPWQAAASLSACLACPADMSTAAKGASSLAQCLCRGGMYRARADGCAPCRPGFYSSPDAGWLDSCLR